MTSHELWTLSTGLADICRPTTRFPATHDPPNAHEESPKPTIQRQFPPSFHEVSRRPSARKRTTAPCGNSEPCPPTAKNEPAHSTRDPVPVSPRGNMVYPPSPKVGSIVPSSVTRR